MKFSTWGRRGRKRRRGKKRKRLESMSSTVGILALYLLNYGCYLLSFFSNKMQPIIRGVHLSSPVHVHLISHALYGCLKKITVFPFRHMHSFICIHRSHENWCRLVAYLHTIDSVVEGASVSLFTFTRTLFYLPLLIFLLLL